MKTQVSSALLLATCLIGACLPSQEAAHVMLPVKVDGSVLADTVTDLGWTIHLDTARIAVKDIEFTILGEMHTSLLRRPNPLGRVWDWIVPNAVAHPGHYAGGDVTGALPGDFVLDWIAGDGAELGLAELIVGEYHGINFKFRLAAELPADDPLSGHTAQFAGTATKDGVKVPFTAIFDLEETAAVIGAPFMEVVDEATKDTFGIQLRSRDEISGADIFDTVDFAALAPPDGGVLMIVPGDATHNVVRRAIQSHVYYNVEPS